MNETRSNFDVIVVGGGPAGSTAATLIAKQGHRVLLLERETFPRHQIGESLLPATVHGICALLGVTEELERANFVRKSGGTFRWGRSADAWTFGFDRLQYLRPHQRYAYQVERAKFDHILLNNARKCGVEVREGHTVQDAILEDGRVVGVRFDDGRGSQQTATARFVVDASGHQSRISKIVGERHYSKFFQNIALYGYYENGKRLPQRPGNILCAAFREGWFWYIPLSDTLTSVGAVVSKDAIERLQGDRENAMRQLIADCPLIQEYLSEARRVTSGMYGSLRVRKDYSYTHSRYWRPGAVLVGDAACFVDPVFSSGVHLGTYGALLAARSINTILGESGLTEEQCLTEFEERYRKEYGLFYDFLVRFYDMQGDEDSYFWSARSVLNTEERANHAFIRLVAGVSDTNEPSFPFAEQFFDERGRVGQIFEAEVELKATKIALSSPDGLEMAPHPEGQRELEKRIAALPEKDRAALHRFYESFGQETVRLLADDALPATPVRSGGLIPSSDGLHWTTSGAA